MSLQESGEMYLETIYVLHKTMDIVRSIDLATAMNFSKPSVSRAVHSLQDGGYLIFEDSGNLKLTEKGSLLAKRIYERHVFFSNYFLALGIDEETAIEDACSIEHAISQKTFEKMREHISSCIDLQDNGYYEQYILKKKETANEQEEDTQA